MKKREINIEFIRVFAIFMTVMIHVSNIYINNLSKLTATDLYAAVTFNSISRICVPLFFMVSGIFLIKQEFNLKNYLKRIFKFSFILVFWSFFYFLFDNNFTFKNFKSTLAESFINADQTSRHLWFLYAIIGIYIALPFIQAMCKNMTVQIENLYLILWLAFSGLEAFYLPLIRYLTKSNVDITYPIPIINAAYYLGYFIAGHILYERFKTSKASLKKNLLCLTCYIIPTIITILTTCISSSILDKIYKPALWYRNILIAIPAFAIFILIVINAEKIKSKFILTFSKHSFGIYLIHMLFVKTVSKFVNIYELDAIIFIPLITLSTYILSFVFSFVISKIPLLKKLIQ